MFQEVPVKPKLRALNDPLALFSLDQDVQLAEKWSFRCHLRGSWRRPEVHPQYHNYTVICETHPIVSPFDGELHRKAGNGVNRSRPGALSHNICTIGCLGYCLANSLLYQNK